METLWTAVTKEAKRGKDCFKISELFADERCSQVTLDFWQPWTADPPVVEIGEGSETSKWQRKV